jgi:hypothetical protein
MSTVPSRTCAECRRGQIPVSALRGRPRLYCSETCRRRGQAKKKAQTGFRGPECLSCGGIRSEVRESGYTADDQRIRRRVCLDCGQAATSVEVYIDPSLTSFWRLNPTRAAQKREKDYQTRGKGIYRLPNRRHEPDRILVMVSLSKGGKQLTTHCNRGHELTPDNTYIQPSSGYRSCVTCRRDRNEARKQLRRAETQRKVA